MDMHVHHSDVRIELSRWARWRRREVVLSCVSVKCDCKKRENYLFLPKVEKRAVVALESVAKGVSWIFVQGVLCALQP